jgi:hypothetical protein
VAQPAQWLVPIAAELRATWATGRSPTCRGRTMPNSSKSTTLKRSRLTKQFEEPNHYRCSATLRSNQLQICFAMYRFIFWVCHSVTQEQILVIVVRYGTTVMRCFPTCLLLLTNTACRTSVSLDREIFQQSDLGISSGMGVVAQASTQAVFS